MSGADYKYVIPATPENIEVRLGSFGLGVDRRIFMEPQGRARLNLFLRFGFVLIVEDRPDVLRIRIAAPRKSDPKLKLSE